MDSPVVVHLIRHEKTPANQERKYIGWTDQSILPITDLTSLSFRPTTVYGSDLKRCEETAKRYFPQVEFMPFKALRELNFGDFEMKTYDQLQHEPIYRQWIDAPENITPPNGESFQAFTKRVLCKFQQIIKEDGAYCFIVHGGVIRLLLSKYGVDVKSFQEIHVSHREIYTLKWEDIRHVKEGKRCESLSVEPIMGKENM